MRGSVVRRGSSKRSVVAPTSSENFALGRTGMKVRGRLTKKPGRSSRLSTTVTESIDERENLIKQIEKLRADNEKMQQMSMTMPTGPNGQFPGGTWGPGMQGRWGQSQGPQNPWGSIANGEQDPEEVLRGFSKKFREKEDKYKAVIEKLTKVNQELVFTKNRHLLEIDTLKSELRRVQSELDHSTSQREKALRTTQEHVAKLAQLKQRHDDYQTMREKQQKLVGERLEKERANRRGQITKLQEELGEKLTTISNLEEQLRSATATSTEALAAKEAMQKELGAPDVKTLQEKVKSVEDENLKARVEIEKQKANYEMVCKSMERSIKEKVSLTEELKKAQAEAKEAFEQSKEASSKLDSLSEEVKALAQNLSLSETDKKTITIELRETREKLLSTEEKLEDAKAEVAQLQSTAEEHRDKYYNLSESYAKEKGTSSASIEELKEVRKEKKCLSQGLLDTKMQVNKLMAENQQLRGQLKLSKDIDSLDIEKLQDILSSSKRMAGALEVIQDHVRAAAHRPPPLQRRVSRLEQRQPSPAEPRDNSIEAGADSDPAAPDDVKQ